MKDEDYLQDIEVDAYENFINEMKKQHQHLGAKKSQHMMNSAEKSEVWEDWANNVQAVINSPNPTMMELELVKLANKCIYLHEFLVRDDNKSSAFKLAEERNKRMNEFQARQVGDEINE